VPFGALVPVVLRTGDATDVTLESFRVLVTAVSGSTIVLAFEGPGPGIGTAPDGEASRTAPDERTVATARERGKAAIEVARKRLCATSLVKRALNAQDGEDAVKPRDVV
jgi:hypothetical protein